MEKWLRQHLQPYMIRPIVYKTLSYFLTALAFALFWDRFANRANLYALSYAYTIIGVFFFAGAWFNYLRLDGIRLPMIKWPKPRSLPFGGMAEHIDHEVVTFDELAEQERNTCSLLANIICGIIFFTLSLF